MWVEKNGESTRLSSAKQTLNKNEFLFICLPTFQKDGIYFSITKWYPSLFRNKWEKLPNEFTFLKKNAVQEKKKPANRQFQTKPRLQSCKTLGAQYLLQQKIEYTLGHCSSNLLAHADMPTAWTIAGIVNTARQIHYGLVRQIQTLHA